MRISDWCSDVCSSDLRAIDFIRDSGETPWCLHLSYIKPHWPYCTGATRPMMGPKRREIGHGDRTSVVKGKSVSVRITLGCRSHIKKTNKPNITSHNR